MKLGNLLLKYENEIMAICFGSKNKWLEVSYFCQDDWIECKNELYDFYDLFTDNNIKIEPIMLTSVFLTYYGLITEKIKIEKESVEKLENIFRKILEELEMD